MQRFARQSIGHTNCSNDAEQRLLARMSVFSGGCTLKPSRKSAAAIPSNTKTIMDLVTGLVARSLVVAEDGEQGTRYRLLETIRQYGEERLADLGETDQILAKHARFYASLSARASEKAYGPGQLACSRQIKLERDNILSALAYAVDTGEAKLAVEIVASHPHQLKAEGPTGDVLLMPALPVVDMPEAAQEPGYPLVLLVAAYNLQATETGTRTSDTAGKP